MESEKDFSDGDIRAFLNNELSDSILADRIAGYLGQHPELLDRYLPGELNAIPTAPGFELVRDDIEGAIAKATKPAIRRRMVITYAAAASVVFLTMVSLFYLVNRNTDKRTEFNAKNSNQVIQNTGLSDSSFLLADGSFIILASQSSIVLPHDFVLNRKIVLQGDGFFRVAKDTAHPFVVHSNNVLTQAVGTEFWVRSKDAQQLTVELLEGKVKISGYETTGASKQTYLKQGERFVYNLNSGDITIASMQAKNPDHTKTALTEANAKNMSRPVNSQSEQAMNNWTNQYIDINRMSLPDLFRKIEAQHKIRILYRQEDVRNIRFTGKIMYTDKPQIILDVVCRMNNLTYSISNDSILITKRDK